MIKPFFVLAVLGGALLAVPCTDRAANAAPTDTKVESKTEAPKAKPRRELSEKQKRNIQIMRECGAEWRAQKAEGKTKGKRWRDYLKDCRAKKKAA